MAIIEGLGIGEYHQSARLSASKLKAFDSRGPRYFHQRFVSRTLPAERSDAFAFGQAFEDLLQRPRTWQEGYAIKPEGLDGRTKEGKAWLAENRDRPVLSAFDVRALTEMAEAVLEHELAKQLIAASAVQLTVTADLLGTPGLQSRPDWLCREGVSASGFRPFVLDLKTCESLDKLRSGRGVIEYGYDVQGALARLCLNANGVADAAVYLLAVEKQTPHRVQVLELSRSFLDRGERIALETCERIARCMARDEWPRCESAVEVLEPPAWAMDMGDVA